MKQQRIILSLLCTCLSAVTVWAQNSDIISFADPEVKRICVKNWDTNGDGELSKQEAAAVTDIGKVFESNEKIKSFHEFQNFTGLTTIGEYSFCRCRNLTVISIPNTVDFIKHRVFWGCSSLIEITIPNSVTKISSGVFADCSNLTNITIPKSLKTIGVAAFAGCYGLTTISVDSDNAYYDSRDDCNAIIETRTNTLIAGCKNTIIPNNVKAIGVSAFEDNTTLTSITIPNSVTIIGSDSFNGCSGLTEINIPSSVINIGKNALGIDGFDSFSRCSGLMSITVDGNNPHYDSRENCNAIIETKTNSLITGCRNTIVPNSVTSIGYCAFNGCSDLTSINIPNSVTSIGGYAFANCSGLTSVTIPNSVTSIDHNAFHGCSGLTSIDIPNSVTNIGRFAFSYCSGLTSLTVGWDAPLSIDTYVLDYINYNNVTLYVPKGTKAKYEATDGWKNFKNIVEMDEETPDPQPTIGELRAEYFIDNDPGYGKATAITEPEWGEKDYKLQLNGVKAGPHVLYVRVKDKEGR